MSRLVGTKGQVTISKEIRDALGVKPGWRAIQRIEGNQVVLQFLPPKHRESLAGILRHATDVVIPTDEELQEKIEEAWAEAMKEKWESMPIPADHSDKLPQ